MIFVALVLFITALPAATVCCDGKPDNTMAAMNASMPCCVTNCTMSRPGTSRDRDVMLTTAPSPQTAAPTVTALMAPASPATETIAAAANDEASIECSAPPPFLLHQQFRI